MPEPPPKVMPGKLARKRTYTEHGYDRNQLEHGAHDLAELTSPIGGQALVSVRVLGRACGITGTSKTSQSRPQEVPELGFTRPASRWSYGLR